MTTPEQTRLALDRLSGGLRRLRDAAGLTGQAAARAVGISQSKLSKIETGALLPSMRDVQRLTEVTGAEDEVAATLLELARMLHSEVESTRVVLQRGAYRKQIEVARREDEAVVNRTFQLTLVPGLLQTPAYMAEVFDVLPPADRAAAAAARQARQLALADPAKRFEFVLAEGVLRYRRGPAAMMADQLDHLIAVSRQENVRLGVIPWMTDLGVTVTHGFHIYDDHLVTLSTHTANAAIRAAGEIAAYRGLFDQLASAAVYGEAARALLGRAATDYRGLN